MIQALESLHDLGYLHQDIKPDNIMRRGNELVLIDMGLSDNYKDA